MTAKGTKATDGGSFEKAIGHTLYEVHYRFSEQSTETVNDKIRRVLQYEITEKL